MILFVRATRLDDDFLSRENIEKKLADLAHHDYEYVPQHQFSWPRKAAAHAHTLGSMHACLAQRILVLIHLAI
jgi:hypothetical protein